MGAGHIEASGSLQSQICLLLTLLSSPLLSSTFIVYKEEESLYWRQCSYSIYSSNTERLLSLLLRRQLSKQWAARRCFWSQLEIRALTSWRHQYAKRRKKEPKRTRRKINMQMSFHHPNLCLVATKPLSTHLALNLDTQKGKIGAAVFGLKHSG